MNANQRRATTMLHVTTVSMPSPANARKVMKANSVKTK